MNLLTIIAQPKPAGMFDFLRAMIATEDGLILFLLGLAKTPRNIAL